jgi:hypothetical protein
MSRLNQSNNLWANLIGPGRGTAGIQRQVRKYAGQVPITPEVIEAATQGMGAAGRERFVAEIAGGVGNPFARGGGGGSSTPHYAPMSGETGEIHFKAHGSGQEFHTVEEDPADVAEQAKRQAMQQELIDRELIGTYGSILRGEHARQPEAFASVNRAEMTAFAAGQMPSAETDAIIMERRRREGSQRAALADYVTKNQRSLTEQDVAGAWAEHFQQYPEFAEGAQAPMTREEKMKQHREQEEQQFQGTLDEFSQANGLGKIPLRRNEKGVLEPVVNVETMISNNRQMANSAQATAARDAVARFNAQMKVLSAQRGQKPDVTATPADRDAWKVKEAQIQSEQQAAFDQLNQSLGSSNAPAESFTAPPADTVDQLPSADYGSFGDAESAFDSGRIKPNQPFSVGGIRGYFDDNGTPHRAP